jgi:hypothetical protein
MVATNMKTSRIGHGIVLLTLLVLLTSGIKGYGERVDMPTAWLRNTATHVVVGTVTAVYESNTTDKEWSTTRCVAEVRVKTVEKGDGLQADGLVYVRYWHRRWVGGNSIPLTTLGHRGLPGAGQTLRIHLARNANNGNGSTNDGGFDVVFANGFEKLKE